MARPIDIAAAATDNFRAHATGPSRGIGEATIRESSRLTWVDSGLDTDTFNVVLGAKLGSAEVEPALGEVLGHFVSVSRPFSWWAAPGDEPGDLGARLEAGGLVPEEYEIAMSADLGSAGLDSVPAVPRLLIERARGEAQLSAFARINAENWSPPDPLVERCYARNAGRLLARDSAQRFYVASLEGRPVAAAEITIAGGVAGVYNLSTREAERGKGIGAAALAAALIDARRNGSSMAVLQSAPLAAGLYRRLGFVEFGRILELRPVRDVR